jgi:hypothetical protein
VIRIAGLAPALGADDQVDHRYLWSPGAEATGLEHRMMEQTKRLALGLGGVGACTAFLVWQPAQVEWVVLPFFASAYTAYDASGLAHGRPSPKSADDSPEF